MYLASINSESINSNSIKRVTRLLFFEEYIFFLSHSFLFQKHTHSFFLCLSLCMNTSFSLFHTHTHYFFLCLSLCMNASFSLYLMFMKCPHTHTIFFFIEPFLLCFKTTCALLSSLFLTSSVINFGMFENEF